MEEEYYQGTTKGKINLLLYLLLSVSLYFIIKHLWHTYLPTPTENTTESLKLYTQNIALASLYGGMFTFFIYLYFSRLLYIFSIRIKTSNQYPPPNSNVPFKQKILRDDKAIKHAKTLVFGSVVMVFIGVLKLGAAIYVAFVLYDITSTF